MRSASRLRVALLLILLIPIAVPAHSQTKSEPSHWGVISGFVPRWRTPSSLNVLFDAEEVNLHGTEFRVGIVRGRTLSGDWGLSLIRKTIASDSTLGNETGSSCSGNFNLVAGAPVGTLNCNRNFSVYRPSHLTLTGVEVHKFVPFGTIKRRVQIGLNVAGGVASEKGTLERHAFSAQSTQPASAGFSPINGGAETIREIGVSSVKLGDLLRGKASVIPIGKVEIAVAAIVAPAMKLRVSGGFNFPGLHEVSITGLYLFGK